MITNCANKYILSLHYIQVLPYWYMVTGMHAKLFAYRDTIIL